MWDIWEKNISYYSKARSTKTRIETWLLSCVHGIIIDSKARSTKTRIETQSCFGLLSAGRDIRKQDPLKQGLKR